MGKHEKTENFVAELDEMEWLKERNRTLAKENLYLKHMLDKEEEAYEYGDAMSKHVIEEKNQYIQELEAEIEKLKAFKAAIVKVVVS